ncbi:alpha/beta hydrolase [Schlegelella sp. S2-27]|uniref:Alpha/beta hydrolase n=1 Tax=Caldimonas mangrovi TaxID=2944811 RepID=A0ABT0YN06_9BURK|nr:alpha/beta hydrolase [Caldimonas mangrovi]MCM5679759.1 alpha/beta hydrolase [Caldimonas mangrovi]
MKLFTRLLVATTAAVATLAHAGQPSEVGDLPAVHSRYATVDGVRIFYREAGHSSLPHIVLLHGFPSSSHMYRKLIPLLATRFHVIAPDYPGFGHSDMPAPTEYRYTFDRLATTMDRFLQAVGVARYVLYMQDYGGPVGLRIAAAHPQRVAGLVAQNANAYDEGLSPEVMKVLRPLWAQRTPDTEAPVRGFFTLEATRGQYTAGARHPEALDPDAWVFDQALLDRPGNHEVQLSLLADYGSNVSLYPQWQRYLRKHQPAMLIAWGRGDPFFLEAGAHAYLRDVPGARLVLLDTGHFALEEEAPRVAREIIATFAGGQVP